MKIQELKKIAFWSAVALIVPLMGQLFVDGWNWGVGGFVFAWVFFIITGSSITFAMKRVSPKYKILAGVAVFLGFALIWARFATG